MLAAAQSSQSYQAVETLILSLGPIRVNENMRQLIHAVELVHEDASLIRRMDRLLPLVEERCGADSARGMGSRLCQARNAILARSRPERLVNLLGHIPRRSPSVADLIYAIETYMRREGLWPE